MRVYSVVDEPNEKKKITVIKRRRMSLGRKITIRISKTWTNSDLNAAGIFFRADAILGNNILNVQLLSDLTCIKIWGSTLRPKWEYADCRHF